MVQGRGWRVAVGGALVSRFARHGESTTSVRVSHGNPQHKLHGGRRRDRAKGTRTVDGRIAWQRIDSQLAEGAVANSGHVVQRHGRGGRPQEKAGDHVVALLEKKKRRTVVRKAF